MKKTLKFLGLEHKTNTAEMSQSSRLIGIRQLAAIGLMVCAGPLFAQEGDAPYTVDCDTGTCLVDKGTYTGWRQYHASCTQCHAQDAVGSTFAPSLVNKLKGMEKDHFVEVVTNGFAGQIGQMPSWKDNPNVMPYLDDLWSYLRARSDGALDPGRPKKMKKGQAEQVSQVTK